MRMFWCMYFESKGCRIIDGYIGRLKCFKGIVGYGVKLFVRFLYFVCVFCEYNNNLYLFSIFYLGGV